MYAPKNHFEAIATIVNVARQELDSETADRIAGDMAAYFEASDSQFDRETFLTGCGF